MARGLVSAVLVVALGSAGCGRLGFDADRQPGSVDGHPRADGPGPDARADGPPVPANLVFTQAANATGGGGDATLTAPLSEGVQAGDLIVIGTSYDFNSSSAPTATASDSAANAYAIAVGPGTEQGYGQEIAYAVAATDGPLSVTITTSVPAATFVETMIVVYRGASGLPLVAAGTTSGNIPGSGQDQDFAGPPLAVPAGAVLVGFVIAHPGAAAVGAPAVTRVAINNDLLEDLVVPTAGTYTLTASADSNAVWTLSAAAFR